MTTIYVYICSKNTGPSWFSDPLRVVGLSLTEEGASAFVPEDFRKYEVTLESQYNNAQDRMAVSGGSVVRHWMADGWWYSVSRHQVVE